ncbi:MAG: Gfo/Idh/MocA family oxidoreductase, partial [Chloroflexota bacterium]
MAKLRVGVIGAGSWTVSSHLPNLVKRRDAGDIELTIVSRRNTELLGRIKDRFGFEKATTDWQEVLAEEPDVVIVGSPPGRHHEQAKAALEAGAQVMCEKPFTIDPADAWDLDQTVKRTGRQLFIAYGWNYRPMVIEAHRLMHEDGGIGDIEHLSMHMDSATRELLSESGDYPGADAEQQVAGQAVPAITWGHSKDHRPDLKQLLYILTVSNDGGVPVYFQAASGNVVDDRTHQATWKLLAELVQRPDFVYVADCKLATTENMNEIARQQGRFITVLPATRKEDAEFRKRLREQPETVTWREAYQLTHEDGTLRDV